MINTKSSIKHRSSRPLAGLVLLFAGIFLLLALGVSTPAGATAVVSNVQPQLIAYIEQQPESTVSVIVQKSDDTDLSATVTELGGTITQDLYIINAFTAELPATKVAALGAADGVHWVSLDAPVVSSGSCKECIDTGSLLSVYPQAIGATQLWNQSNYLQGQGIGVAIVDSGIAFHGDLGVNANGKGNSRIIVSQKFNSNANSATDQYGHGTHIAGIIGGNGAQSKGMQIGIAPKVNLISVKVSDDKGMGSTADVIAGLQWILENKDTYNIRVVNLSINSAVQESYHVSPLNAAVEILWFNGIVVVVSAGNNGIGDNGILYPPANDPFVITVGAVDDKGTVDRADDVLASYSAYGITQEGLAKPEIVAPGSNIISLMASNGAELVKGHPDHKVDGFAGGKNYYFRMSGTSMSTGVVSGAVALLLQDEPGLNPDQVKYRLMATAAPFAGPMPGSTGAGYLDIYAAVNGNTTATANTGTAASQLLWSGSDPITWGSVNWASVNWASVNWASVNWASVNWASVNWASVNWDD